MIPDPQNRTVKILIKIVNGYPCLFPESRLPELKEGAIGDLIVSADAFVDEKVVFEYTQERKEEFLPAGTVLVAQINPEKVPQDLKDHIKSNMPGYMGAGVEFILVEEQQILRRGTKNSKLIQCKCQIPSLEKDAKSINHAYSIISEAFEPHRISHTGNVFSKVYYQDNSTWRPLKDRRGHL